jgi:predicted Na+-dependent transporter
MSRFLDILSRYQLVLVLLALIGGLLFPWIFLPLNPFNSLLLQLIMLATGLRLNLNEFVHEAGDWRLLVIANGTMLIGLPFLVAIPLATFAPEWTLPFVLAAAMPTGLTAPAVVTILGGRTSLAVLISVSTSLLSPFIIPLVLKVMAGKTVAFDTVGMMLNIAWVVIFPLAFALFLQWKFGKKRIERQANAIRFLGLVAFVLVIASVSASSVATSTQQGEMQNGFMAIGTDGLIIVILMTAFWAGIAWLASTMLTWRTAIDRMTVAFCLVYLNTTLSVWIADTFFHETNIAPKMVAIFIATTLVLPIFKFFIPHDRRKAYKKIYTVEQV